MKSKRTGNRTLNHTFRRNAMGLSLALLAPWLCSFALAAGPVAAENQVGGVAAAAPAKGKFCEIQDTKTCQDAVTPAMIVERLKQGNQRFVSGKPTQRNYLKQVKATGDGKFPLASIVSCIDSRAPAEILFDQGIGDLFNARVAGNIVNEDILGSLEFASKLAGSKVVVVLGHSSCGAIKGACDDAKLGNLTGLLGKIKPAVVSVSATSADKDKSSKNYKFVEMVAEANVNATVQTIRDKSPILREMEQKGEIMIVGAMYDVKTGTVAWYNTPASSSKPVSAGPAK